MTLERKQLESLTDALGALVRATRTVAHRDTGHGLGATSIALLTAVSDGDLRLGTLAEKLLVKPSVASRAVDALEEEGLVRRVADADDARARRIRITDAGRRHLDERRARYLDVIAHTLADWTPKDVEQAVRVLDRLETAVLQWTPALERAVQEGADPQPTSAAADKTLEDVKS